MSADTPDTAETLARKIAQWPTAIRDYADLVADRWEGDPKIKAARFLAMQEVADLIQKAVDALPPAR